MDNFQKFQDRKIFDNIDVLRAISIILVMLHHSPYRDLLFKNGNFGVTIFFLISGFLITTLLLREKFKTGIKIKNFFIRR